MTENMRIRFVVLCLWCVLTAASTAVGQTSDSSPRFPVYLNNKYGYINQQGQMVIQPRFEFVTNFSEGLAAVIENRYWDFIDISGRVLIATRSSKVRPFSEGLAAVLVGDRYGYIDKKGNFVIEPQFEAAFDFSEGLARVKLNGQWAFIDTGGRTVFVAAFDYVDDFQGGYAVVAKVFGDRAHRGFAAGDLKVSYIGKTGSLTSTGWCNAASRFSETLATISTDSNIIAGISRGGLVMDNLDISDPANSIAKPVKYSFINTNGQTLFEGTFQAVRAFADGRAAVRTNDKWGYINQLGEMIIPARFDAVEPFSAGLAFVKLNDEGYFIDTSGKVVFRTPASVMSPFKNGLARLMTCSVKPCESMYVDKQGKIVWRGVFDVEQRIPNR